MNGIFVVKHVGVTESVACSNGGEMQKRIVVLTTKECRMGDSGAYTVDQEFVVSLLGEKAEQCTLMPEDIIVAELSFVARSWNNTFYPDIRLNKYCKQ